MEEEVKQNYLEAGEIVQKARDKARDEAEDGRNLKDIAEAIENLIRNEGLKPAFPVNMSLNDEAAHYTPSKEEERVLSKDDVLKIDIGAHSNGYIADTALTVNPSGKYKEQIETVEKVLKNALEFIEPGKTVGEFGSYVENQVPDGLTPVVNLTGHSLGRYTQHAGLSIPNVSNTNNYTFEKGDAVAIEPFISLGSGKVANGKEGNIYKLESDKARGRTPRKVIKKAKKFNDLPFTDRWMDLEGKEKFAFKRLVKSGQIHSYPVLKDTDKVFQAEHTVLIGEGADGQNIVTTRRTS
ncbi:MAG: methionyl aminopeptidase [Candidatus Nanohaloarchaea archaeon]|jgi:methionyl aminopeptidase